MIKIENVEVTGWNHAIRGMRNPMNSWHLSDSYPAVVCGKCGVIDRDGICCPKEHDCSQFECFVIGENDLKLMQTLAKRGADESKFLRMITVTCDITAPLYWWKEYDTYKVGTVSNSCSTMHMIHAKEFTLDDFSHEYLFDGIFLCDEDRSVDMEYYENSTTVLEYIISKLNYYRNKFIETKEKIYWWQMIQLLPTSYNQKRTIQLNYAVLRNINRPNSRKYHKLDEWRVFCIWCDSLPYYLDIFRECGE